MSIRSQAQLRMQEEQRRRIEEERRRQQLEQERNRLASEVIRAKSIVDKQAAIAEMYAPEYFASTREDLKRWENLTSNDPNTLTQEIQNLNYYISSFEANCRNELATWKRNYEIQQQQKAELERLEREAQRLKCEAQRNQTLFLIEAAQNWDLEVYTRAHEQLVALYEQVAEQDEINQEEVKAQLSQIQQQVSAQLESERQAQKQQVEKEVVQTTRTRLLDQINQAALEVKAKEQLEQVLKEASSIEQVHQVGQQLAEAEFKQQVEEDVRKEMVKAIYKSLKTAGFNPLKPKLQTTDDGETIVVVQASRPNGNQANFRVSIDGSVIYKFDNYKGQLCKQDMEKVLPQFEEIYGIKLSDERVLWSNPDDQLMDAKPINPITTTKAKGK